MLRVNLILLVIAVCCALGSVTAQHKARKLFQALEAEQDRARQLEVEYDQLQLDLSTWAAHPRIEKIARERLKMMPPALADYPARPAAVAVAANTLAVEGGR
ncbi:MAG: cell division protein FtsL [Zoogloeaceae bacterium]|nr:cell division protein FtsL [Zoogloeaceae bacterium]